MADGNFILTQEGKDKLEEELHFLETEKRAEIGERIKVAREARGRGEGAGTGHACLRKQANLHGRPHERRRAALRPHTVRGRRARAAL